VTGRLFPTGSRRDVFEIPGTGKVEATFIDAANPVVLVRAEAIGLEGTEIEAIDEDPAIKAVLEAIRCQAAVRVGIAASEAEATQFSQAVPKIAVVTVPKTYTTTGGLTLPANDQDLTARFMSMGTLHRSFAVSGAVSTAGAAMVPGTVVHEVLTDAARAREQLRIGHPGGVMDIGAVLDLRGETVLYREAVLGRTARRLMEGYVLVPERHFA
jgi:2-methylaconitate cis-trans-isomerase PrpF